MSNGRLETRITLSTAEWAGTIDVGGGAQAWSFPDAVPHVDRFDYFETELLAALATALTTAAGEAITVTGDFGENGSGRVTIDRTAAGTMAVVFTNTEHRAFLGFTGALTGANSYTGSNGCTGVWLPDCPMSEKFGSQDEGHYLVPIKQVASRSGHRQTLLLGRQTGPGHRDDLNWGLGARQVLNSVWWSHVSRARARRAHESGGVMSYERWLLEGQLGEHALLQPGAPINLYFDANAADKFTYSLDLDGTTDMQRVVADWSGLFRIDLSGTRTPGT